MRSNIIHVLAIAPFFALSVASQTCYWPNGTSVAATNSSYFACSSEGDSACCLEGEVCLSNGLCYGATYGTTYRGACTDKSWTTSACPQLCTATGESTWPWSNVFPCYDTQWWCGSSDDNRCNASLGHMFEWSTAKVLGIVTNSSAAVTSSISASSVVNSATVSGSSSSTASASNNGNSGISNSTTCDVDSGKVSKSVPIGVGVGIGVPLAIIAAAFAALWAMERRRRIGAEKDYSALPKSNSNDYQTSPQMGGPGVYVNGHTAYDPPRHGPVIAEADNERAVSELPGVGGQGGNYYK